MYSHIFTKEPESNAKYEPQTLRKENLLQTVLPKNFILVSNHTIFAGSIL